MDDGLSAAVKETFVTLYHEGLIYRDRRLVNWDPKLQTAISDLEVENREIKGSLWYLRYPIEDEPGQFIIVATTRPETMLGDTAVAVHPDHPAYGGADRQAGHPAAGWPRRSRSSATPMRTRKKAPARSRSRPAHDFNDFEVGRRHDLPMPSVLDRQAMVTLAEIEDALTAVPGVADPGFRPQRWRVSPGLPRAAPSWPNWNGWNCLTGSSRTPTRCRTATVAACRSSRC